MEEYRIMEDVIKIGIYDLLYVKELDSYGAYNSKETCTEGVNYNKQKIIIRLSS
jgi:hypothetical protein